MMHLFLAAALALADAERLAVERAPAVAEARATVDERQALYDAARGAGAPHAFVNYAASPQAGNFNNTLEQQFTTVGGAFNLTDITSAAPLTMQAAADLRSARAGQIAAERTETLKAIGLYADALRTGEVYRLRTILLDYARNDESAARKRFGAGDAPRLDIVRAQVARSKAEADAASARADAENALFALSVEIGVPVDRIALPPFPSLREQVPPIVPESTAVERALATRGELAGARADVSAEEAAIAAARHGAAPAVTAQVGYAKGVDTGIPVQGPSATINVDLPLSHSAQDRVRAEEARLREAQARYDIAEQSVRVEVESALRSFAAQREAASSTAAARSEAEAELRATETGYRNGASSSLDVTDARRTYAQAVIDDVTAQAALYQAAATLSLSMGVHP